MTTPTDNSSDQSREMREAIGARLLQARRLKGWSVRELSVQTGVSKALISRLERGEANPSLETLWRIIGVLGIPFSQLIRAGDDESELVRHGSGRAFVTDDKFMEVSLLSASADGMLEIYELTMPPEASSEWHSHGAGTRETVYVLDGQAIVEVGSKRFELFPGDLLGFSADRDHVYHSHSQPLRVICIMRYTNVNPTINRAVH
jgi:transcriptional regulator with XRE-family HTH domain